MVSCKTQCCILISHCNEQSQGQPEVTAERNSEPPGSIIPSRLYIEPSLVIYYWNTIFFSMLKKFWVMYSDVIVTLRGQMITIYTAERRVRLRIARMWIGTFLFRQSMSIGTTARERMDKRI